jgi:hypothetical protein
MTANKGLHCLAAFFVICGCILLFGQSGSDKVVWSGSVRSRVEIWDWFDGAANYGFLELTYKF